MSQTITLTTEQAEAFGRGEVITIAPPEQPTKNVVIAVYPDGTVYRIVNAIAIEGNSAYKGSYEVLYDCASNDNNDNSGITYGYFSSRYTFIEVDGNP